MKKFIFITTIFFTFITQVSFSQKLITVQNGSSSTFYTTLDLAISNAGAGDTIYIPGGGHTISSPITKKLHLVGAGSNADSTYAVGITIINQITLYTGADGGSIEGIYIYGGFNFGSGTTESVNGYLVKRCNITNIVFNSSNGLSNSSNISIIECNIIGTPIIGQPTMILINNCKIAGHLYGLTNSVIQNNIFFSGNNFSGISCTFKNNIFLQLVGLGGTNCTYLHNINVVNGINVGSYGSGNIIESPENTFVNSGTEDYHLKATSLGKNAGTDGTDIGIYGGAFPWKEGSIPFNPHFQTVQIAPTTDSIGNLNVNIKVAAQDR
ncbi:MAG: hypothetical protein FD155_1810 [Bacteroidetes bacterium]|nr:MAG: hypothetical protein FD155_1810 [Bacteroidota bacterium]